MNKLVQSAVFLRVLFVLLVLSLTGWIVVAQENIGRATLLQSKMIWSGPDNRTPEFTVFRKTFDLQNMDVGTFHIFADSKYILWINGTEVLRGPCRFDPRAPSFDSMEVESFLKNGKNTIVVMVMSHGSNGKMMDHSPGLAAGLEIKKFSGKTQTIWTDTSWRWNTKTRFLPPVQNWGFVCDRIDARIDDGNWTQIEYDDSRWANAVSADGTGWGKLMPRTIPLLAEKEMGWQPLNKQKLPVELISGQSYIIRANELIQGFPRIKLEAGEGVVIHFEMGYSGDSTQVGETYGAFCSYTAKSGEQEFVPTDSYGFRYLKITILRGEKGVPFHVRLKKIDLIDRRYPYLETGRFECNDSFLNDLWKRSALTMKVNCEDGYMDCALREKSEWMGDGAVVQYPLSRTIFAIADSAGVPRSDAGLIVSMLRHIALSQSDSGMFKAHHPSDRFDIHGYIEDYSCLWVQALRDVYEQTGNTDLVRELWEPLKKQMKYFEDHLTPNGLVYGREFTFIDNPLVYDRCEGATLNAFVYKAFRDAAFLASVTGNSKAREKFEKLADRLSENFDEHLWIPSKQTYSSGLSDSRQMMPTPHAALLALNRGIVPESRKQQVKNYLFCHYDDGGKNVAQNGVIPDHFFDLNLAVRGIDHPYTAFWLFEEMYKDGRDSEALDFMHKKWEQMMRDTVIGTLWEAFGGGDRCHNMGAVPAYFLSSKVLGVSERLPVTSKVVGIEPHLGNLAWAEGTVVTEFGPVLVKWKKMDKGLTFSIDIPQNVQAEVILPYSESAQRILVNNREMPYTRIGNRLIFKTNETISEGYLIGESD